MPGAGGGHEKQLGRMMLLEQIDGVKQIVAERNRRRKRQELERGSADSPLHIHDAGRSLAINVVTGEGIMEVGDLAIKEAVRLAVDPQRWAALLRIPTLRIRRSNVAAL